MGRYLTTYIVSGYMRTGTSMMMQCLVACGMESVHDLRREQMNQRWGDRFYRPNKHGFYEPWYSQLRDPGFPRQYEGKLLKVLWGGLSALVELPGGYKIVFMRRHPEEIRQSYEGFFGKPLRLPSLFHYEERMRYALDYIENRSDMQLSAVFQYRDVVDNPLPAFQKLANAGWPIDPHVAAAQVDPTQCRFKLENLEVGI